MPTDIDHPHNGRVNLGLYIDEEQSSDDDETRLPNVMSSN